MSIKRRACFIFAVLLTALIPLAVFSSAALDPSEYNLVPDDATTWTPYCDNGTVTLGRNSVVNNSIMIINNQGATVNAAGPQVVATCAASAIPSGSLVPGSSYSISFTVPSDSEIIAATGRTQAQIDAQWSRVVACFVGLGYIGNDGDLMLIENCSINYTHAQAAQYYGQVNYINFVCPDYSGKQLYFVVGFLRGGSSSTANTYIYIGRHYGLVDFAKKQELEEYNRLWYGNSDGDYSNPFTTENYDLGDASDTDELESAFEDFEDGLDNLTAPFRIVGRLLNDIFGANAPFAIIGTIVFLVLIFAVVFRLFGVT